jgi:hypothetical protein
VIKSLRILLIIAALGALVGIPGRIVTAQPAPTTAPAAALDKRFVLHLPGIGGMMRIDRNLVDGLSQGGFDRDEIQIYDWTGKDRGLVALGQQTRHDTESTKIAELITRHFRENPTVPITITSHSAGCGMAVWALEKLPDDVKVDSLVMMQSALSPGYDLSKALRHVRGHVYSLYSEHDPVLGAGTRLMGTVDRVFTDAAGRVGYRKPDGADDEQYQKLVQMPYRDEWTRFGDIGDHIGPMTRAFARSMLVPLITEGAFPPIPALPTTRP